MTQSEAGRPPLHLMVFMTWDVSLKIWKEKGLLERELKLYQELEKYGVRTTIMTWGGDEDVQIAKSIPGIHIVPIYSKTRRIENKVLRAVQSFFIPFLYRREIQKADLLKTNQMWGSWVGVVAKYCTRRPLILRSGYELYDFTCKQGHGVLRRSFIKLISWVGYKNADHCIVAAHHDADIAQRVFNVPKTKISVFQNWIDTDRFVNYGREKPDEKSILFVGRLNRQKNLPMLIAALSGTPYALVIAGEGEMRAELEVQAEKDGVKVRFLGAVPNDQLPDLYNRHPVFVLPSHYEGNPKTLLEAMACGAAVIGTDVDGVNTVIRHDVSGLLCAKEVPALRRSIDTLMTDADLRRRLGQAAAKQIRDTQSLEQTAHKEWALYQRILQNRA